MPTDRQHSRFVDAVMDIIGAARDILHSWRFAGMPRNKWSYSPNRNPTAEQIIYWQAAAAWNNWDENEDARFLDYWLEVLEYNLRDYAHVSRAYMRRELLRRFIGMGLNECRVNFHCFYREKDWEKLLDVWQVQFGMLRDLGSFRRAMTDYVREGTHMPVIADIYSRVPESAYYREQEQRQAGGEASGANIIPFGREAAQA